MLELDMDGLRRVVEKHDYAPLFVTVSGAHLYGFPSPDSDVDLRGCHKLPLSDVVGLDTPRETIEPEFDRMVEGNTGCREEHYEHEQRDARPSMGAAQQSPPGGATRHLRPVRPSPRARAAAALHGQPG